jgi:hypothetical protein
VTHTHTVSQSQKGPPPFLCDCVHTHAVTVTRSPGIGTALNVPYAACTRTRSHLAVAVTHAQSCGHSEERWPVVRQCVSACKFTQAHRHILRWLCGLCTQTRSHTRTVTQSQYTLCVTVCVTECVTVSLSQRTQPPPSRVGGVAVNAQSHIVTDAQSRRV